MALRPGKGDEKFSIGIDPAPKLVAEKFTRLRGQLEDWRPAWRALLPSLVEGVKRNFDSQGSALGEQWHPGQARYLRRKIREGWSRTPGVRFGRLKGQVNSGSGYRKIGKRSVSYGVNLPYARAFQYGNKRRFVGWNDNMRAHAVAAMNAHVDASLKESVV